MKKISTFLTLMFISIISYADDFNQSKILPHKLNTFLTDNIYIQNVNFDNQYLALGELQEDTLPDSTLQYYNVVFNGVGDPIMLTHQDEGIFTLHMKNKDSGAWHPLYILHDVYYPFLFPGTERKLVAVVIPYDDPRGEESTYSSIFTANTLNEKNSRVSWYNDINGYIARAHNDGQEVLFDKLYVDSRDSRRWNFFVREE